MSGFTVCNGQPFNRTWTRICAGFVHLTRSWPDHCRCAREPQPRQSSSGRSTGRDPTICKVHPCVRTLQPEPFPAFQTVLGRPSLTRRNITFHAASMVLRPVPPPSLQGWQRVMRAAAATRVLVALLVASRLYPLQPMTQAAKPDPSSLLRAGGCHLAASIFGSYSHQRPSRSRTTQLLVSIVNSSHVSGWGWGPPQTSPNSLCC